jgi:ATP-dependent Lon protease
MPYYKTCQRCGATLDPNEKCDCLYADALPIAVEKCHRIIALYGDDNGVRRTEAYLARIIREEMLSLSMEEQFGADAYKHHAKSSKITA